MPAGPAPSPSPARQRAGWFGAGIGTAAAVFLAYELFVAPSLGVRVTAAPRPTPAPVVVHVVGEVNRPGVYQMDPSARVRDAVEQAGGATAAADPGQVNLAARVADGQRIAVPRAAVPTDPPSAEPGTVPAPATGVPGRVNLNTASSAELDTLPGVGPATVQKILEQRQKQRFARVEELLELKLVNSATFARLRDLVVVE